MITILLIAAVTLLAVVRAVLSERRKRRLIATGQARRVYNDGDMF